MGFIIESKCNESCLTSANSLYQNNELKKLFAHFHYLICDELLFLIILNSLITDLLHFLSVFTHGFIQLFFNVMNRIKIINQVQLAWAVN